MINHNNVTTNTNTNIVVTKLQNKNTRQEVQPSNFGIIEGNVINFDGIETKQHTQFGHTFPYLQSNMYKSTNGTVAYCLDNGLYGASGTDNSYTDTNKQLSPQTLYILANGYNGTQESLNRFTKWEEWGFTDTEAFEATQLAVWASNNAAPDCRLNLNDLYSTNTRGKAIIQAAKELYNDAQNANNNLTINGNLHFPKINGSEETYGPFTLSAGLPLSSYIVSVSGNPTAEVVNADGQAITGPIKAGTPFYIKVSAKNLSKTTISVKATTAIKSGVIQSNGQTYYQNYANETPANVTLSSDLSFEPKVAPISDTPKPQPKQVTPKVAPAPKVTPAPKDDVTNNNVNKPSNNNEQHQSQTQTVNNKPTVNNHPTNKDEQHQSTTINNKPSVKNSNTASPNDTNRDEQHQSTTVNNKPTVNNHPTNTNNITASPDQSPNQSNHNSFSPIIKINIYNNNDNSNSNSNSNANANGNDSKATGNSSANSNANTNGNGSAKAKSDAGNKSGNVNSNANSNSNVNGNRSSAKADSTAKGGNANANANSNADNKTASSSASGKNVNTNSNSNANDSKTATPANASSNIVSGNQTQGLPFTGLTSAQINNHADADLAYGGLFTIIAFIAGILGIKKFK